MLANPPFVDYFSHNALHRTPNAFIIFLLETRLKGLSFDIKNESFGPLSQLQYFFFKYPTLLPQQFLCGKDVELETRQERKTHEHKK